MSGSVFRRQGQKTEVQGKPNEVQFDQEQLQQKLAELQKTLSAPLTASAQSVAVWHPKYQVAEVTMQRGSTLPRMGFKWRRKLFLHAEEAVYLVSKGNLLLMQGSIGQQQLLSLQAATSLLVSAGVSMERYQVYCRLMRAGYIVTRCCHISPLYNLQLHGHVCSIDLVPFHSMTCDAATNMKATAELSCGGVTVEYLVPSGMFQLLLSTRHLWVPTNRDEYDMPAPPPSKRARQERSAGSGRAGNHRAWWPLAPSDADEALQLSFRVMLTAEETQLPQFLKFGQIQASVPSALRTIDITSTDAGVPGQTHVQLVYDVLRPNKHFSKNKPDAPQLGVALATGDYVPHLSIFSDMQHAVGPLPLQLARVSGGEVSFHSFQAK